MQTISEETQQLLHHIFGECNWPDEEIIQIARETAYHQHSPFGTTLLLKGVQAFYDRVQPIIYAETGEKFWDADWHYVLTQVMDFIWDVLDVIESEEE